MTTHILELRQKARVAKVKKLKAIVTEVASLILLLGIIWAFCWLCCAASGYHWE